MLSLGTNYLIQYRIPLISPVVFYIPSSQKGIPLGNVVIKEMNLKLKDKYVYNPFFSILLGFELSYIPMNILGMEQLGKRLEFVLCDFMTKESFIVLENTQGFNRVKCKK